MWFLWQLYGLQIFLRVGITFTTYSEHCRAVKLQRIINVQTKHIILSKNLIITEKYLYVLWYLKAELWVFFFNFIIACFFKSIKTLKESSHLQISIYKCTVMLCTLPCIIHTWLCECHILSQATFEKEKYIGAVYWGKFAVQTLGS